MDGMGCKHWSYQNLLSGQNLEREKEGILGRVWSAVEGWCGRARVVDLRGPVSICFFSEREGKVKNGRLEAALGGGGSSSSRQI